MDLYGVRRRRRVVRLGLAVALAVALVVLVAAETAPDVPLAAPTGTAAPAAPVTDLATTAPAPVTSHRPHSGPLLVLGDSLVVGAQDAGLTKLLTADGWQPTIVAEVGRSTRGGILAVQQDVRSVPPLVVVELGTNPGSAISTFAADVDALVDLLRAKGAQRIVWLTPVHHDDDRYADKDRVLAAKAAADPAVTVADWAALATANKAWFRDDGLHYTSTGFTALAHFIADAADQHDPT